MLAMRIVRLLTGRSPAIRGVLATLSIARDRTPRLALLACLLACSLSGVALGEPMWTTYHRDPGRSGDDPDATQPITPALAWQTESLAAPIWSQPLVLGERAYVATVGDEIYALEASTGKVIWQQSAGTPVPADELPCGDITPTVGIVGTPVIDTSTGAIYAVADTWNASTHEAQHMLKGYRLSNGEQMLSVPVDPPGSVPLDLLQRTALNLDGSDLIFGFGGNDGDCADYRGTVVAAPLDGGAPRFWQVPIAPPSVSGGAVWAPSGPAVDSAGNVYATTGNPDPPVGERATTYDYSDSVVRLNPAQDFVADPETEPAAPLGWFEPPNWEEESNNDLDLSSSGAELLPGGLLFQAGKDGRGYLIEETSMSSVYSHQVCAGHGSFGGEAYASGVIYIACTNGTQALAYNQAARTFTPLWQGPSDAFGPPIVSPGLVWVVATGGFSGGGTKLYGLDPATGTPRYTETLPSPVADHFASPSAAGGRLFVSTGESVTAYQISQPPSTATGAPAGNLTTPANSSATATNAGMTSSVTTPDTSPRVSPSRRLYAPTLAHTDLLAGARGRVEVELHCPATAGECGGTLTLRAEIVVSIQGKRHIRRVAPITLARTRFGPHSGYFIVVVRLSRDAEAHLHRHHDRLALQVLVASPGSEVRLTVATLTQSA
jgi:outer membrane protein assembly factor BamB